MIRKPGNWDNVQEPSNRPKLPLGCYVVKIMAAIVEDGSFGQALSVRFDINEGDYAGFYYKDYSASQNIDKKWGGRKYVYIPMDDGSEADERTKSNFKAFVTAVEQSNLGYSWDWDEKSLVGKVVGVVMRNEEWSFNGRHGWSVRPFRFTSADKVRNGMASCPPDKPLQRETTADAQSTGYTPVQVDNSDLPF